jgi:phage-related protein
MRRRAPVQEKPLHWVGSSKKDLLELPEEVVDNIGYALGVVQLGGHPPSAKPWKGSGAGIFEIVETDRAGTYRAVYVVRFEKAVYVLHVFQKKSPSGIRTARTDAALIEQRLELAKQHYEATYGEKKD